MTKLNIADKSLIRQINMSAILQVIREKEPISRAEISKLTGLNPATVSNNVSNLIQMKIVREIGSGESSGGRKPVLLELNPKAFYIIGVDMGTTKVITAVTDIEGKIVKKVVMRFPKDRTVKVVIDIIKDSIYKVIEGSNIEVDKILGIGMGVHGLVDCDKGISIYAPAFDWHNIDIKKIFEDEFSVPVNIDNDARVMALGEKWFGRAKNALDFVCLNIGTAIGSGIYLNGELYRGSSFGAGEIGHINIVNRGPRCNCGNYGCLEVMASGPAIVDRFIERINCGEKSKVIDFVDGNLSNITGEIIFKAAIEGDELSKTILNETGRYIGLAVSVIINLLNPEMILIGGGVSKAGEFIFDAIKDTVFQKSMKHNVENTYIGPTGLGENCGVIGAATLILKDIFKAPKLY
ncbi:ROK family transcriptional regulator [Caloranaerobacter azorensis]|uniref:ROK family transcriptional regulator n=1 Tax=Caloranaerobacter azorensis TaxID=116090 RepID=A0A6P1YGJ1_9FIRM|nr:ROK family transcriptional regulator [Caloranaerobacter azorensis]QIB27036.1 ROK family transcriptional regulator [Caloranaerobacter azorensis]